VPTPTPTPVPINAPLSVDTIVGMIIARLVALNSTDPQLVALLAQYQTATGHPFLS
jgi:hypothetical protein